MTMGSAEVETYMSGAKVVSIKSASGLSVAGFDELRANASGTGVFVRGDDDSLSLYFDFATVQSRMRRDTPAELVLGYTRTMMGFLLLAPRPERIAMIGLGGGSMPKYCYAKLPRAAIVVVEIDPAVIALRDQFLVPQDDRRFQVLHMDGADFMRGLANPVANPVALPVDESFDVIVVDGFDARGQPAQLCSLDFYDNAHRKLAAGGVMAVNLHHNDFLDVAVARLRQVFDDAVIVVDCETSANRIAFAFKGDLAAVLDRQLSSRVRELSQHHPVELCRTARRLRREWLNRWIEQQLNEDEAAFT
jgi:spermidine synthase